MKSNYPTSRDRGPSGKPSFGDRGPRKSFGDRKPSFGDRGPRKSFGDRPSFGDRKPSFGDRGPRPSFGDRKPFGDRPSFGDRGPRKSFGDRPSFGDRGPRPSFGDRKPFGDRPSFGDRGPRKSFGDRKPSFGDRGPRPSFGDRKPFNRSEREYKPRDKNESFPENSQFRVKRDFSHDFEKETSKQDDKISSMKNAMTMAEGSEDTIRPRKQRSYMRTTPQSDQKVASTSWGEVADWYDNHLETDDDTYHNKVILPNLKRLIDAKEKEKILEIACGQGFFTRRFQEEYKDATFVGVDLGEDLIAIAKKRAPTMKFSVGNAEDLNEIKDKTYNAVYIVLAIQNIEHLDALLREVDRILKKGGTFHIVMNHPTFRIPKETSWEYVDEKGIQARRVDSYLSEMKVEMDMHPGMFNSPKTLSFHRPLQTYFKSLAKHNMPVDRLEEWISHKVSDSGPKASAENKARKEFPMFMYLRAKKI